jgi:bifunctional non-homologous end joining protein LigD
VQRVVEPLWDGVATPTAIFKNAFKMGLEGIVSERLCAPYRSGPSRDWIKVKNPDSLAMIRAREAEW